jgi:ketosteroid isomerase-like protein
MKPVDDPISLMRTWIAALNERDRATCRTAWCENAVWRNRATGRSWNGPEEITAQLWTWHDACPDLHVEMTDGFSSLSRGGIETTWTGTHAGLLIAPPGRRDGVGRRLNWSAGYLFDTRNGKVSSVTEYCDSWRVLLYPSSFPTLASVEVRGRAASRSIPRVFTNRGLFPALAAIDVMTSFPELAGIPWEEEDGGMAGALAFHAPMATTFPDIARSRW